MAVKIALAGNPNCGKTTLFNALTGANQYVGNWPGVTVEKKEGKLIGHKDVDLVDLPGIYSLSPYTLEEVVARNYLIGEQPDAIINIVDGTNIERNLYLTTQIIELGIPVLMAVNMMDIVKKNGDTINIKALGEKLGCEVVEISALKKTGIKETAEKAIQIAKSGKSVQRVHHFADDVESTIAGIEDKLGLAVAENQKRFFAIKLLERDSKISEVLKSAPNVDAEIKALEDKYDDDTESIITNERYQYISSIIGSCVKKARAGKETVSDKIDKIVTNRFLALPIFALIMWAVYYVAVSSLGGIVTDWTNDTLFGEWIQPAVQTFMENAGCSEWLVSLVVEGIIGGLGAPIGFAPQMAIVFLFLSILEDCGYMARVAFIMDRIFRRFGLSGKSFIPFLIGSGCGVPGIMATRTIENEKDRRMTMMTVTNIPCGAKLPVIALIAGFIMGDGCWWMAPLMYFAGIGLTIIYCIILKKTRAFAGEPAPFVMELPQYHIPSVKGVLLHVWERVWAFLKKAGTILFLCCAVMWFLSSFGIQDGAFGLVDTENSLLAVIGSAIAVIFAPLGFDTWQAVASSLSGFVAKEGIVSTMGVLSGLGEVEEYAVSMHDQFAAFLLFNLFDSPCLAAISTTAKELNNRKFFWFTIIFQNVSAYCVTLMFYQIVGLCIGEVAFNFWTVVAFVLLAGVLYLLFRKDPNKATVKSSSFAASNV
jgi:ferrous iron transport protein B